MRPLTYATDAVVVGGRVVIDDALDATGVVVGASVVVALVGTDVSGVDTGSPSPLAKRATPPTTAARTRTPTSTTVPMRRGRSRATT
jgi:hypothetical protein